MQRGRNIVLAMAMLFVVYFPIAWQLKASYVPSDPNSVQLVRSFHRFGGFAFSSVPLRFKELADTPAAPDNSPLMLYEDGKPLGQPHSVHADIASKGNGRFSHWGKIIIFSTSDNSDPNTNGREYRLALPKDRP